jgi:hypothetical protein
MQIRVDDASRAFRLPAPDEQTQAVDAGGEETEKGSLKDCS